MGKSILIIILLVFFLIAGVFIYFTYSNKSNVLVSEKIDQVNLDLFKTDTERRKNQKICPDAWIDDQMPVVGQKPVNSQYFIIDGERWEYDELDVNWVSHNCKINKPIKVF